MRRHTNFARVANHRLLLLRLAPSSARLALRNSAYRRTSSKSLSVKPPVADVSAVTRESSEVRLGKNVAIGTEKKRDKLSRSSGVGLYLPVSHLDTVFAATFSLAVIEQQVAQQIARKWTDIVALEPGTLAGAGQSDGENDGAFARTRRVRDGCMRQLGGNGVGAGRINGDCKRRFRRIERSKSRN